MEALVLTLAPLFPERSFKSIREDLEDDSTRGLHLLLTSYTKQSGTSVLLVIDQFEELFTQTDTEIERQHFLDILLTATTEPSGPVLAILTLRADFYDRPLQYPNLGHLIEHHHVTVYPMEMRDLRTVIEQPVRLPDVQLTFEEDLVGDLLFDVQGQVGALPLLQFTLEQLFYHRKERLLTIGAYCKIGGIKRAIANHAELTFQSLPTQTHQRLARALFLRLINPGATDQDATKRRILNSELVVIDPEETAKLAEVKNAFLNARLLTSNTVGETPTIEVSHEALIRAWPRLEQWLHEAYEDIRLQQTISRDAAEWQRRGQSVDRLYRGSQLKEALKWRETNLPSRDEDSFLQASIDECQRVQRFEHQQKQSYTRRMVMIGAVGVVGIAGTLFFARKIYENVFSPPVLPVKSLPYIYSGHSKAVNSMAWSPDGKQIASGSNDQTVQVWDASNGSPLLTYRGHSNVVNSVAWSPDGERIASGGGDKTVQVWSAGKGNTLLTYVGHSDTVYSVAWSPDGKRIALGSNDITVQVWSFSNGTLRFTYKGHTSSVNSVAWSPDGKRIASAGGDQTVQVWNAPAN